MTGARRGFAPGVPGVVMFATTPAAERLQPLTVVISLAVAALVFAGRRLPVQRGAA
jgi:hypothetical protein